MCVCPSFFLAKKEFLTSMVQPKASNFESTVQKSILFSLAVKVFFLLEEKVSKNKTKIDQKKFVLIKSQRFLNVKLYTAPTKTNTTAFTIFCSNIG